jgi:ABC-type transport system involved in cytochrome bd biosynthesis fused ATPase/permease subunit
MDILLKHSEGTTIVMVTHEQGGRQATRIVRVFDGLVVRRPHVQELSADGMESLHAPQLFTPSTCCASC